MRKTHPFLKNTMVDENLIVVPKKLLKETQYAIHAWAGRQLITMSSWNRRINTYLSSTKSE
jgi:hypothetical protein